MYEFDKGDLFIEIGDNGEHFDFFDTTDNIYIIVGGILRLHISKAQDLMRNDFMFYAADGMTLVNHMEFIDPSTIGEDNG
jgi:hypothetical protein